MAFTTKILQATLNLASGSFDVDGGNTSTISNLRMLAKIADKGGPTQSFIDLQIFGLPLSTMNQMSNVGTQFNKQQNNTLILEAGDDPSNLSKVFEGTIFNAFVDAQKMPEINFHVVAKPGVYHSVKPVEPITKQGAVDAATLLSQVAGTMGLAFENNGVSVMLNNPYYPHNSTVQVDEICNHAGISYSLSNGTLAIWKPGTARNGDAIIIQPPPLGSMVGYPVFDSQKVIVTNEFNPLFKMGGQIQVISELTPACGMFSVLSLEHILESQVPKGRWFSTLIANQIGANIG